MKVVSDLSDNWTVALKLLCRTMRGEQSSPAASEVFQNSREPAVETVMIFHLDIHLAYTSNALRKSWNEARLQILDQSEQIGIGTIEMRR